MRICSIEGCDSKHEAKGYCKSHYRKYKKYGDPLFETKRSVSVSYESNHKYIDEIEHKCCSDCSEWKPMNEKYFYKNKSSKIDGFNPYCKLCTIERSKKYQKDNPEWTKSYAKIIYKRKEKYFKDKAKRWSTENEEKHKSQQKEWRQENPEKLRHYQIERNMHKSHNISDDELNELYEYCNHSCMYCGISEEEHKKIHNQVLHKDHAANDGSDGIDNCVLACKSCNSSKNTKDWDEWYTPINPKYTYERYIKIKEWLCKFTI